MTTLGERIRVARESAGLSQTALGRLLGITSQSVNMWEQGKKRPSRENIVKLIKITRAPSEWLLYGGPFPEQDENGKFVVQGNGGHFVPMLRLVDAIHQREPQPNAPRIHAYFPCGPRAFHFVLPNNSNAPDYPEGTVWIVDPDRAAEPGRMVLAAHGDPKQPVFGRLRFETTGTGRVTVVAPLDKEWPQARSDIEHVEIIAVMTESIRSGS